MRLEHYDPWETTVTHSVTELHNMKIAYRARLEKLLDAGVITLPYPEFCNRCEGRFGLPCLDCEMAGGRPTMFWTIK